MEGDFASMADAILNGMSLVTARCRYRIIEVEMYYYHAYAHPDPYVHQSEEQGRMHRFYFHRFGNGTFKAGTWMGLDLCFGSTQHFLGVLVRSMLDEEAERSIQGPCRVVRQILADFSCSGLPDLVRDVLGGQLDYDFFDSSRRLHVVRHSSNPSAVWSGPRQGLSHKWPEFQMRHYRFCILPQWTGKGRRQLLPVRYAGYDEH